MELTVYIALPLSADLAAFSQHLRQQQIIHRIVEHNDELQLWAQNAATLTQISQLYKEFVDAGEVVQAVQSDGNPANYLAAGLGYLLLFPVTIGSILLSIIVALFSWYISDSLLHLFLFQDVTFVNGRIVFLEASLPWVGGQYWRFITPAFLHFGWLHLVFNSLWMWEFGRSIEQHQGHLRILLLLLVVGIVSNVAQFLWAGSALFGGLSGVIYGFAGYCWLWSKLVPAQRFSMPDSLFYALVAIMLIMMTGVFGTLGLGEIANTAHFIGLVSGLVCALFFALLRPRQSQE
jgi:GlpG protein|tara:strand:- start:7658 stop:8530 length:873 start_codon:yes stop_codon:yes gene_type:complete